MSTLSLSTLYKNWSVVNLILGRTSICDTSPCTNGRCIDNARDPKGYTCQCPADTRLSADGRSCIGESRFPTHEVVPLFRFWFTLQIHCVVLLYQSAYFTTLFGPLCGSTRDSGYLSVSGSTIPNAIAYILQPFNLVWSWIKFNQIS